MNVLIVVPWDQARGGVATVVNTLARHLSEHGHGVLFLHPGESARPVAKTTRAGFPGVELNLRVPFIPERPLRSSAAFWLMLPVTLRRLLALLRRHEIDLVSIHYPLPWAVIFLLTGRLLGHRVVISAHGADLMPNGEQCAHHPWGLRWLIARCDHLTAPSRSYLGDVLSAFPGLRDRATPIHNGIDLAELRAEAGVSSPSGAPSILCIAAHNAKKGLDVLLRALLHLRSQGVEAKLVLAGDGPLRPDLEALAHHLGIADLVHFAGFLDLAAVRRALERCTLFVLPSRAEPFGIALLEAMAHGKPIVATRVGGIPEIITHLENGYLIPPDDPRALADAVAALARDPALRERLGRAGLATVRERFTYRHTGSKFETLFLALLQGGERGVS
jgi:glycosyltransferase involved in cell wall biosynthesis